MAHSYSIVKSWVDKGRPGVHCGYVKITMADNYDSGYAIEASDINPNLSTLYQLTVLGGAVTTVDNIYRILSWDYDNQKLVSYMADSGLVEDDADVLDDAVLYCYYEGS